VKEKELKMENQEILKKLETLAAQQVKYEKKLKEHDDLFSQLYDFPVIAAEIMQCTEDMARLTREIANYNKGKNEEIVLLKVRLADKESQLKTMMLKLAQLKESKILEQRDLF